MAAWLVTHGAIESESEQGDMFLEAAKQSIESLPKLATLGDKASSEADASAPTDCSVQRQERLARHFGQ